MDNFKTYFREAYQKMLLEKDFDISKDVLDGAKAWQEDDSVDGLAGLDTDIETIDVIDPEAEQEDELEDSYVGKVILECVACHSKMVVDESKVYEDEETQTASPDIPCPVCNAELGYTILGKVEPFEKEEAEEEPLEFPAEDEEEVEEEEEVVEESLHDRIRRKHLGEAKNLHEADNEYPKAVLLRDKKRTVRVFNKEQEKFVLSHTPEEVMQVAHK